MARKPNYAFEKNAKAKAKAEKREAKRQAKIATKAKEDAADSTSELHEDATRAGSAADDSA